MEMDKDNKFRDDVDYYKTHIQVGHICSKKDLSNGCVNSQPVDAVK